MIIKTIPYSWIVEEQRRFDCGPFTRGGIEAKKALERASLPKEPLVSLTADGLAGMYHVGMDKLRWVDAQTDGIPFLRSSDILRADLTGQPKIARSQVEGNPLFRCPEGTTLITRSGTIGRMAFCRSDMVEMAMSQDVLKVVPNTAKIPAGYLYAFLSSKFGIPMVVSGTFGSIIVHIEAENVSDLPVPRLAEAREAEIHSLVVRAGQLRVEASKQLAKAKGLALRSWGVLDDGDCAHREHPDVQVVALSEVRRSGRFDAFYYGSSARNADARLRSIEAEIPIKRLGSRSVTSEVFETTRFGRVSVSDPDYGVPFLSISDLVRVDPKPEALISRKQARTVRAHVDAGWLVLPRVGQLQGVFGTVCFVPRHLDGVAISDNNIRIVPTDERTGAYLWAALSTDICYQQIVRRACGTSIPYLDASRVEDIPVPWPEEAHRNEVAALVIDGMEKRSDASASESRAIRLAELSVEEAS